MLAQAGERISDYEVLKLLGRGSFGVVPHGCDSECTSDRQLALFFDMGAKGAVRNELPLTDMFGVVGGSAAVKCDSVTSPAHLPASFVITNET